MIRQSELIEKVIKYDPKADVDALNRAYDYALKAHGDQQRASGAPYFSHPLEVANILATLKMDTATIITGLLHDTVEDTSTTLDEVEKIFGEEVRTLVDGVTKLSKLEWKSDQTKQADNFRKLLVAMSEDLRVLLVKLADRLHNMRTLHHIKSEEKRLSTANETMEIYAPLAERIGLHGVKEELQDLAFGQLNKQARESIVTRLHFLREKGENVMHTIIDKLKKALKKNGLDATLSGREKAPYSIWRKMRRYNINFEQLTDIIAYRIIVDTQDDCYRALGIIHNAYSVIPNRFKDYISTPKPNKYQSIHTAVYGPKHYRIEIQIRTQEMHDIAETGVAAHWQYKQGSDEQSQHYAWLRGLLEILEKTTDPEEFLEQTKLEMFQDQVFCFTPGGDLFALPTGATPIDFAYAIHSEIGNHCIGAKINGRMTPLRSVLKNGDQIEIVTSKTQSPSPNWERLVITGKARANIRRYLRSKQRDEFAQLGKAILHKTFKHESLAFNEKLFTPTVLKKFNCEVHDDLYAAIGEGLQSVQDVIHLLHPRHKLKPKREVPLDAKKESPQEVDHILSLKGLIPGMAVHYAGCCHPIPGDKIVGIVITGKGVTVHTYDCENLEQYSNEPDRWLDVSWDLKAANMETHVGRLSVHILNNPGALAELSTVISQQDANILNLKITSRSETLYEILIDLEVKDTDHLANVLGSLRSSKQITSVERARD